jgi:hypothetical protein
MADRISVDPEQMRAAARGMETFSEMFASNLARNNLVANEYLDAFGGDEFGRNLYQQYEEMALPLQDNSGSLVEAVERVGTNAGYSAESWHQTSNLPGPTHVPTDTTVKPTQPEHHPVVHR